MKTKHTKGEWLNLGYRVDVDVADGMSGICEMSDWMPEEEMEANSKLIAAAPELLEVLQDINKYFVDLQNRCALTPHEERTWKKVSKIIQKAIE
jgi:hypothetical protein